MKRYIHFSGTLEESGARFVDALNRAERGEEVEPEWHLTFATKRPHGQHRTVERIRQAIRACIKRA